MSSSCRNPLDHAGSPSSTIFLPTLSLWDNVSLRQMRNSMSDLTSLRSSTTTNLYRIAFQLAQAAPFLHRWQSSSVSHHLKKSGHLASSTSPLTNSNTKLPSLHIWTTSGERRPSFLATILMSSLPRTPSRHAKSPSSTIFLPTLSLWDNISSKRMHTLRRWVLTSHG
jgi:hypothetical protein